MHLPEIIFSSGLDRALGWTVLHSIWQGALIALLTGFLLIFMRHKSAQMRYWIANMALLSMLCTSAGTFIWYSEENSTLPVSPPPMGQTESILLKKAAADVKGLSAAQPSLTLQNRPTSPADSSWSDIRGYFERHLPLVLLIWFAGMMVLLLKLLGGILQVYYLRRRLNFPADPYWSDIMDRLIEKSGFRTGIELLESALVRSPLTIGHIRPLVLFPIGMINHLSEREVEAVLAHELAHIIRKDYLFNILQSFVECLFYYHPAVWWLSAQVRREREHACDDRAIALLGNKMNYAKALVAIQEMAFYPVTPALAFAGQHKNQLLSRVQRLFSQPKSSFNVMEKWISTVLVASLFLVLAFGQQLPQGTPHPNTLVENGNATVNAGIWEAEFKNDSVHLTLSSHEHGNWIMGDEFSRKSFSNLVVADGEAAFQLNRAAGKMSFTGKIEGKTGYGRFVFAPEESYRNALGKEGIQSVDDELLLQCFLADFPADYPSTLQKSGFKQVTKDQLLQLAVFRLNEPSVKKYQDLAATLGQKQLSIGDVVQMKVTDVTPEKVKRLEKAGYGNLDLETVSQFSLQHVEPEYIEQMNNLGFGKLSGEDLLSAKIQGIDPDFVKQSISLGLGNLKFEDVMSLKIQGVDSEYVQEIRNMDLGNLNSDQIVSLKVQGVDAGYVKEVQNMGLGKLDFDQILSLKVQGVDADYVKQVQNIGLENLNFDKVMSLKVQGVDADYMKQVEEMGLGKPDFEQLMQCRIFDINPDMVKSFRDLNFKHLTMEDLVAAKIHNITSKYIKDAVAKGTVYPTLQEYIELKLRNEWNNRRAN